MARLPWQNSGNHPAKINPGVGGNIGNPQRKEAKSIIMDSSIGSLKQKLHAAVIKPAIDITTREKCLEQIAREALSKSKVMREPNFGRVSTEDLGRMVEAYDNLFLGGVCLPLARSYGLKFRWSSRMTSTGGKTVRTVYRNPPPGTSPIQYEIVLSSSLLFQTFRDIDRPIRVSGIMCSNRLEAMQRIVEHELLHLVEMLVWDDSCCAAKRFQSIAWRLFAHTEHKHDLVTQQERAAVQFKLKVGSPVQFSYEGRIYRGVVNRITRRATVLVQDPKGQPFTDGRRYTKYYIPLTHLKPISQ